MLRALWPLLSCLTDYEAIGDLTQNAFAASLINIAILCCIGTVFAVQRRQ